MGLASNWQMPGCVWPSRLLTVTAERSNSTRPPLRFCFTVTNCTSCTCIWAKHWRSEVFYWSFFFKWCRLSVNLYVEWTFSTTPACGRSGRTSIESQPNHVLSIVECSRGKIHFSGHHNASNLSWKPATILSFHIAYTIWTQWKCSKQLDFFFILWCL